MEGFLAALGLSKGAIVGGFLGALVSLKFIEGQNLWQRASTVFAGTVGAAFVTPIAVVKFSVSQTLESGLAFLIGVIFMSMAGALIKAIPEFVAAAKTKFLGN